MSKADNKLSGAIDLGTLGITPLNKKGVVNPSDRDSLYRFKLGGRNHLNMGFTAAKGAGYELYSVKRSWSTLLKSIGSLDFRQLRGRKLGDSLQRVNPGELDAGDYIIRVLHRSGKSRYRFQVAAQVVEPLKLPPKEVVKPQNLPPKEVVKPQNLPPKVLVVDPLAPLQVVSDRFAFSGNPAGGETFVSFDIDFSKSKNEDPRPGFGLFRDAVLSGVGRFPSNGEYVFTQPGDLIAFKDKSGLTHYAARVTNETYALIGGMRIYGDDQFPSDPGSLESLESFMKNKPRSIQVSGTLATLDANPADIELNLSYVGTNTPAYRMGNGEKDFTVSADFKLAVLGNELGNTIIGNQNDNELSGLAGNDHLQGKEGSDQLKGAEGDDWLEGGDGDYDYLNGGTGNDRLEGGEGDDILTGFGSLGLDASEFDILIGGGGEDRFVLGNYNFQSRNFEPFYVESGDGYAIIQDWGFRGVKDKIDVVGSKSLYSFESKNVVGNSTADIEIYYKSGSINDRIAIVQDPTVTLATFIAEFNQ